jgi:hypothetical protein
MAIHRVAAHIHNVFFAEGSAELWCRLRRNKRDRYCPSVPWRRGVLDGYVSGAHRSLRRLAMVESASSIAGPMASATAAFIGTPKDSASTG